MLDPTLLAADILTRQALRRLTEGVDHRDEDQRHLLLDYPARPARPPRVALWRRLFAPRPRTAPSPCC